jgi:hypothetical protein
MGVRISLNVGMPSGYKPGDGKVYPAPIVTDGDFAFPGVYEAARSLGGAITPLFIVSVGTAMDEGEAEHTRRWRTTAGCSSRRKDVAPEVPGSSSRQSPPR